MYNIYITKVKNIRPAENADKLNLCDAFGNTTVVDKSVNENDLYIYFPVDGQISKEYGEVNDLFARKDENGKKCGGFIDASKRNIRAIRLRGNRSDGLVMPLSSLSSFGDISTLKEGDIVTVFNGHEIARKYIPLQRQVEYNKRTYGSKIPKVKVPIAPLFEEHIDTEQLAYNQTAFKYGDEIEISIKMHGTSGRTAYLPVFKGYKKTWKDKLFHREGTPTYEYDYVSGTRRTTLSSWEGGYYGDNGFRKKHHDFFVGKLHRGEEIFYEIVGFTDSGVPIMPSVKNSKAGDDFVKVYGDVTEFSYGCDPKGIEAPQSEIYVYRMTMTNEDGFTVEYSPDFMRYRCEQIGVKCVPSVYHGFIPYNEAELGWRHDHDEYPIDAGKWVMRLAEKFYDGADPIGKTHVREGVVVRIVNRPKFTAYKHKNFDFKILSGIIVNEITADSIEKISEDVLSEL